MGGGFDVGIEGVGSRHVDEGWRGRGVEANPEAEDHYLGKLPTPGRGVRPEGAVSIPRYCSMAIQVPDRLVEVVALVYVAERDRRGCRCGAGSSDPGGRACGRGNGRGCRVTSLRTESDGRVGCY